MEKSGIAVQLAVGDLGKKAVTFFENFQFNSMAVIGGYPIGCNTDGVFLLNTGSRDGTSVITRTVSFSSSDFGINSNKRIRYIYLGIELVSATSGTITVTVTPNDDSSLAKDYDVRITKSGLQRIRVPVGRDVSGRYLQIKIESIEEYRLDSVEALVLPRPRGVSKNGVN